MERVAIFYSHSKFSGKIHVVKRPTDSIIYRTYSISHARTMIAREKRHIEHMNSCPDMMRKDSQDDPDSPIKEKKFKRFQTMPVIEMEDEAFLQETATVHAAP